LRKKIQRMNGEHKRRESIKSAAKELETIVGFFPLWLEGPRNALTEHFRRGGARVTYSYTCHLAFTRSILSIVAYADYTLHTS